MEITDILRDPFDTPPHLDLSSYKSSWKRPATSPDQGSRKGLVKRFTKYRPHNSRDGNVSEEDICITVPEKLGGSSSLGLVEKRRAMIQKASTFGKQKRVVQ
jgi:hypothetical protein